LLLRMLMLPLRETDSMYPVGVHSTDSSAYMRGFSTFHQNTWEGCRHFITWGSSADGSDFDEAVVDDGVDVSLAVTTSYRHLIFVQQSTTGGVISNPPLWWWWGCYW
jgi:hypothetical protein